MRVLVLLVEFGGTLCVTYIDFLEVKGKGYLYCDQIKKKILNQEKIQCYAACLPVSYVCRMKKTRYNNVGIICHASGC